MAGVFWMRQALGDELLRVEVVDAAPAIFRRQIFRRHESAARTMAAELIGESAELSARVFVAVFVGSVADLDGELAVAVNDERLPQRDAVLFGEVAQPLRYTGFALA